MRQRRWDLYSQWDENVAHSLAKQVGVASARFFFKVHPKRVLSHTLLLSCFCFNRIAERFQQKRTVTPSKQFSQMSPRKGVTIGHVIFQPSIFRGQPLLFRVVRVSHRTRLLIPWILQIALCSRRSVDPDILVLLTSLGGLDAGVEWCCFFCCFYVCKIDSLQVSLTNIWMEVMTKRSN